MSYNYYEILGVTEDASTEAITSADRDAVLQHHPDKDNRPHATERFKHIRNAYETLTSPRQRHQYDELGHDEYVEEHGGYSLDEFAEYVTTTSARHSGSTEDIAVVTRESIQQNRGQWKREQDNTAKRTSESPEQGTGGFREWLVQGRTHQSEGGKAYAVRFISFLAVLYFLGTVIQSALIFTGAAIGLRILYLLGFEELRRRHIKIELSPGPDADVLIYALLPGVAGIVAVAAGGLLYITGDVSSGLSMVFGSSILLVLVGLFVVMGMGWAVADDAYNLRLDVNPVYWNAAVQLPFMTAIGMLLAQTNWLLSAIIGILPHLVAGLYLLSYHPELITELRYRVPFGRTNRARGSP
jgi:hypothetical protein